MPNIIIKEIDETSAGSQAASTDIAYVPGFADTNAGVYIYNTAVVYSGETITGGGPTTSTPGVVALTTDTYNSHHQYPCFACNILDKKSWKCTVASNAPSYTWTEIDYIAPAPENTPVLCTTLDEFNESFGELPYKWVAGYTSAGVAETDTEALARAAYPTFTADAMSTITTNYAYNLNDYEKSYIYAKELIALGVPVIYENVVKRTSNRKEEPSVIYLYQQLVSCYDELQDKGEYTVKYITSGAYPTFEYTGETSTTTDYTKNGNFPYSADAADLPTSVDVTTDFVDASGATVAPQRVDITVTYTPDGQQEPVITSIQVTNAGYAEDGTHNWGGSGNTIGLTSNGFTVSLVQNWEWDSATYIASATVTTTTGGTSIYTKMTTLAYNRGDCVALIDHTNYPTRKLTGSGSVYEVVKSTNITNGEFGTMFTPWASYSTVSEGVSVPSVQIMPASFGYLLSLAKSIKTNANWLAVAGVARGLVPHIVSLNTVDRLSNTVANVYQPRDDIAINPITTIKPYGLTIWGNRTLKKNVSNLVATSFLNTRNTISDVKKVAYTTAKSLIFEQNSAVLWINFKAGITPLLDQMVSGQGLSGYKIIKGTTTEKAKVVAVIKLYPLYAVEDFDITVTISDDEVSVS